MNLTTPVTIAANTTYIASYHTTGAYVATTNFFTADANDSSRQWLGGVKRSQEPGFCAPAKLAGALRHVSAAGQPPLV